MIEWAKKFFGQSSSGATAKERLRLVLMTDHLALAPELIEQMKRDLIDVISRYVEVDREKVEVNFEREDRALAMLANIPIKAVNRPTGGNDVKTDTAEKAVAEPAAAAAQMAAHVPEDARGGAPPVRARRKRKKSSPPKAAPAH